MDVVDESAAGSGGIDTVQSSISFNLANMTWVKGAVENLTLLGTSGLVATGNSLANALRGNGAGNVLNGASGNDRLDGAGGKDVLTGGVGRDTYVFSSALDALNNVDVVKDFNVVADTIALDNAVMPAGSRDRNAVRRPLLEEQHGSGATGSSTKRVRASCSTMPTEMAPGAGCIWRRWAPTSN